MEELALPARTAALPSSFVVREGINTPIEEAFERYRETLGLRQGLDSLAAVTETAASPLVPGQSVTLYRQHYRGVPVDGYGYLVHHVKGSFSFGLRAGYFAGINSVVTPTVTAETAVSTALAHLQPTERPCESNQNIPAPSAELLLRPTLPGVQPVEPGLKLIWRVRFSGIQAAYVDIDALSGAVLFEQTRSLGITECAGFDPAAARVLERGPTFSRRALQRHGGPTAQRSRDGALDSEHDVIRDV